MTEIVQMFQAPVAKRDVFVTKNGKVASEHVLPIVMVKDPYTWMTSMCRHPYAAQWTRDSLGRCPNLVDEAGSQVQVDVHFNDPFRRTFESMVDFWNSWYMEWMNAPYPRLIVRYEDVLFHPESTVRQLCQCAGGDLVGQFKFPQKSAKSGKGHGPEGSSSNHTTALSRYGNAKARYEAFSTKDLEFAETHLKATLMGLFGY